jgi:hypothetical protein
MRLATWFGLLLGLLLRYGPALAQPAPPQCLRPQVVDDNGWLVFFDAHSAALAPRARQILGELAVAFLENHGRFVGLNGYTDGAETAPEDVGLGLRRAEAVAGALREDGIEPRAIYAKDLGAATPLVPRPPGVAEPQNRVELLPMLGLSDHALRMQRECKAWLRATCFQSLTPEQHALCERALNVAAPGG